MTQKEQYREWDLLVNILENNRVLSEVCIHLTAFGATGPLAGEITSKHHLTSNYGTNSPFDIMTKYKTVILGLGVHYYRCLTQVHHVEDIMGDKFPVNFNIDTTLVNIKSENEIFNYNLTYKYTPLIRRVDLLEKLLTKQELYQWKFHGIPMFRVKASDISNGADKLCQSGKIYLLLIIFFNVQVIELI